MDHCGKASTPITAKGSIEDHAPLTDEKIKEIQDALKYLQIAVEDYKENPSGPNYMRVASQSAAMSSATISIILRFARMPIDENLIDPMISNSLFSMSKG